MDQFDLFDAPASVAKSYQPVKPFSFLDDDWADRGHAAVFRIVCERCRVPGYLRRAVLGWSSSVPTRRAYSALAA